MNDKAESRRIFKSPTNGLLEGMPFPEYPLYFTTEEHHNEASVNNKNLPKTVWVFSPLMPFLLILYIDNKASLAIRHEINWSLEMRYFGVL